MSVYNASISWPEPSCKVGLKVESHVCYNAFIIIVNYF